jgi:hypothetical protein
LYRATTEADASVDVFGVKAALASVASQATTAKADAGASNATGVEEAVADATGQENSVTPSASADVVVEVEG